MRPAYAIELESLRDSIDLYLRIGCEVLLEGIEAKMAIILNETRGSAVLLIDAAGGIDAIETPVD